MMQSKKEQGYVLPANEPRLPGGVPLSRAAEQGGAVDLLCRRRRARLLPGLEGMPDAHRGLVSLYLSPYLGVGALEGNAKTC
jgi:phage tail protein X